MFKLLINSNNLKQFYYFKNARNFDKFLNLISRWCFQFFLNKINWRLENRIICKVKITFNCVQVPDEFKADLVYQPEHLNRRNVGEDEYKSKVIEHTNVGDR